MLYSYDIFDTVLFRKVPKSTDIFVVMEKEIEGLWKNDFGSFAEVRKKTEFWARRILAKEISIEDIYRRIQKITCLSDLDINKLINIELRTEKRYTVLNMSVVNEIKTRIENGEQVILISDMYWHEKQIRCWLAEKDAIFLTVPIYISCDYGNTKASGKLFQLVKVKENADYSAWLHVGDNSKSDIIAPAKLLIKTKLVKGRRKYAFEKTLNIQDENILEVYEAISESVGNSNGDAFSMGASIVGPMVYQYTKWVVEEAEKKSIKTLYFVLRDGYILKKVADLIIRGKNLDIKTHYIFGSRVAWRFPEITVDKLKNLTVWDKSNWIFRDPAIAYVPLERLGFNKQQVDHLFGTEFGKQELRTFNEFKKMLDYCLMENAFTEALEQNIINAKELLNRYLRQTIDFRESFAFVDTNSTGKTQKDINRMLASIDSGLGKLRFFYHTFLGNEDVDNLTQFAFIDSKEDDRRLPEAFFRAPMNQCYGYKIDIDKDIVVPRLHESTKCAWNYSFDYDSYLDGIIEFVSRIGDANVDSYVDYLLKVVNFKIISKDEIHQAAKMPFNPDLNGDEILDFYPKLSVHALFHPFSQLLYYPKGSYYDSGGMWILIYKVLIIMVHLRRTIGNQK